MIKDVQKNMFAKKIEMENADAHRDFLDFELEMKNSLKVVKLYIYSYFTSVKGQNDLFQIVFNKFLYT